MSKIQSWWDRQNEEFRSAVGVGIVVAGLIVAVLILNASVRP